MSEIINDFQSVEPTKTQRFLLLLTLVLLIIANTNPGNYVMSGDVTDLYFMSIVEDGGHVGVGVFNHVWRVK